MRHLLASASGITQAIGTNLRVIITHIRIHDLSYSTVLLEYYTSHISFPCVQIREAIGLRRPDHRVQPGELEVEVFQFEAVTHSFVSKYDIEYHQIPNQLTQNPLLTNGPRFYCLFFLLCQAKLG